MRLSYLAFRGVPCCERLSSYDVDHLINSTSSLRLAQSPEQAELMLVFGKITQKQAPCLLNLWSDFIYPAKIVHFAGCALAPKNYALVESLSDIVTLDAVIDTCELNVNLIRETFSRLKYRRNNTNNEH